MESWDIDNAFLQGLDFRTLREKAKELNIEMKAIRRVYLTPPRNVWRHFRELKVEGSYIVVEDCDVPWALLLCLKPMYGFVDAPILWQLALLLWIVSTMLGTQSLLDENYVYWTHGYEVDLSMAVHVDDINAVGKKTWMDWAHRRLEERFGTVKRQTLPFTHVGIQHELVAPGVLRLSQNEHLDNISPAPVPEYAKEDEALSKVSQHDFVSLLSAMLWDCQCRMDCMSEVVQLQAFNKQATISHLLEANKLLSKGKRNSPMMGLYYRRLKMPLRVVDVTDAGHASKKSSYAQEGLMTLLMEDKPLTIDFKSDEVKNIDDIGGAAHLLAGHGRRSKRVSHSTSHAETLSKVNGMGTAQLIALRFTELFCKTMYGQTANVKLLMEIQQRGSTILPIDSYTDCMDLWELACGMRGIPSDKSQRLCILSIREERMTRRIRGFGHLPTSCILPDALTKVGTFPVLMHWQTTGIWQVNATTTRGKPIKMRVMERREEEDIDEDDLVNIPN